MRDSATGAVSFDRDVALGERPGADPGRRTSWVWTSGSTSRAGWCPTFAGRSDDDIAALLDATDAVIEALRSAGVEPFVALRHPARRGPRGRGARPRLRRRPRLRQQPHEPGGRGPRVLRDPASAPAGRMARRRATAAARSRSTSPRPTVTRGLDVFGGFLDDGRLYLMGEIGTDFERDWIYPLGTAELDGRPMPVPARPEKLLEAMYGPGWRTPDPAFKFSTPTRTIRAFDDWFRGTQPGSRYWAKRAHVMAHKPLRQTPSRLAKRALALAAPLGRRGARHRRRPRGRQPVAGASGPLRDGVRLRDPRAPAGPGLRRGGVARPGGALPQPHRVAVGLRRGRSAGAPAAAASRPRAARRRRHVRASAGRHWRGCARWRCARAGAARRVPPADRRRGPRGRSSGWSGDPTSTRSLRCCATPALPAST